MSTPKERRIVEDELVHLWIEREGADNGSCDSELNTEDAVDFADESCTDGGLFEVLTA